MAQRKIVFIGPMGAGKTTLARAYANKRGVDFIDIDELFEARFGSIDAFFARFGEEEFRRRECELMIEAAESDCGAVACGGGAVLNTRGVNALRRAGDIVYLYAPTDILIERISSSARPLKNNASELFAARRPLYEKYADYSLDTAQGSLNELEALLSRKRANRFDVLLCDSDDTLLDFSAACREALVGALDKLGIAADGEQAYKLFRPITDEVWRRLERGELTRERLFVERAKLFSAALGVELVPGEFTSAYRESLHDTKCVIPGAVDFLKKVRNRGIKVYIITNADVYCASERLKALCGETDGVFISEGMGVNKPERAYFEAVLKAVGEPDRSRVAVFGDSESSDIKGGRDCSLNTVLFDRSGKKQTEADFSVKSYEEVLDIL